MAVKSIVGLERESVLFLGQEASSEAAVGTLVMDRPTELGIKAPSRSLKSWKVQNLAKPSRNLPVAASYDHL